MNPHDTSSPRSCACGCGEPVGAGRKWVSGHNFKDLKRTDTHKKNLSRAATRAWQTKRQRMPLGSTYITSDGYVVVKVVEGAGLWRPQHVLVVEEEMGRALRPGEVVHHINGVRDDNRAENLHVFHSKSEHNAAHKSFSDLLGSLLGDGLVVFNSETGRYER